MKAIWIPWSALKATYRGNDKGDAPEMKTSNIKHIGVMCRRFFGEQEDYFELEIEKIDARKMARGDDMLVVPGKRVSLVEKHESFKICKIRPPSNILKRASVSIVGVSWERQCHGAS